MSQIELSEREKDALRIIISMAQVYNWQLYGKKEGCNYWEQHKENIDMVHNHHDKFHQGIMATAIDILDKLKN